MTSTSESGHQKNVANFDELISFATGYGSTYKPTKTSLSIDALKALSEQAKAAHIAVVSAEAALKSAVAAREAAFLPLSKLSTRILNSIKASDTTQQVDENVRTVVRKIQGVRASAKKTDQQKEALAEHGKKVVEISSSQMGFDSRLDNLFKLIQLLLSIPEYNPNEEELKIAYLNTLMEDLKLKNAAVIEKTIPLSNARISRNNILYKDDTGLCDMAMNVKTYLKSLFGPTSLEYKQISSLSFKKIKL